MSQTYISNRLAKACCALLGSTSHVLIAHPHIAEHSEPWSMNIGLANYIERDRNTGIEIIVNGSRAIDEDRLNVQLELDVITGATPNGATASDIAQSFTQASGLGSYFVSANELPADDTHMDTRLGLSLLYNDKINGDFSMAYRSHLSMEFDYLSIGTGIDLKHDFNQHNSSLTLAIDFEYNNVHPVGNIPIAFASTQPPGALQARAKARSTKRVTGLSFGVTQLINPQSLIQLKYAYAEATGYLTDPYKILSVIEQPTGNTLDYLFEHRPDSRINQSVYTAYKLYFSGDVLDLSYRYYWDEWDIRSNTLDIRYLNKLSNDTFIHPHLRYYQQSAADFFAHSLPDNQPLPEFASADFRLAEFDAYTLGFKYGKQTGENKEHSINVEYYTQQGNSHPADAIGLQKNQDLFPTLYTLVLFYNYAFIW